MKFTREDFVDFLSQFFEGSPGVASEIASHVATLAQRKLDGYLREAPMIYAEILSNGELHDCGMYPTHEDMQATHTAKLVCIEEIEDND